MTMSELTDQLHVDKCGNKITKIENVFLAKHKHYDSHTIKYSYGQTNTTISWHVTEKLAMFSGVVQLRAYHVDLQYANLPVK